MRQIQHLINAEVNRLLEKQAQSKKTGHKEVDIEKLASGLKKVQEISNEDFHLEKMADAARGVAEIAIDSIGEMGSQIDDLKSKNDILEKSAEVREVIEHMLDKGIISNDTVHEKVAELMSKSQRDIEIVKEASKMMTSFHHEKIGSLENDEPVVPGKRKNPMDEVIEESM